MGVRGSSSKSLVGWIFEFENTFGLDLCINKLTAYMYMYMYSKCMYMYLCMCPIGMDSSCMQDKVLSYVMLINYFFVNYSYTCMKN